MGLEHESRGSTVVVTTGIMTTIATVFVIARLVARMGVLKNGGYDELAVVVSILASHGVLVGFIQQVKYGLGKHFSTLDRSDAERTLMWLFVTILFYNIALTSTKLSIVLQYLRVFIGKRTRLSCFIVMSLVSAYGIIGVFTTIFACIPIKAFWTGDRSARCTNRKVLWFFNAGFNMFTDILIIALPMPSLSSLKLPKRQKIGLMCIFALGGFTCLISVLRLRFVYITSTSPDITWNNVDLATWSVIELNTGIICACLPTLKPVVSRLFPRLLGTSRNRSQGPAYSHEHGSNTNPLYKLAPVRLADKDHEREGAMEVEVGKRNGSVGERKSSEENKRCGSFATTRTLDAWNKSEMGSDKDLVVQKWHE